MLLEQKIPVTYQRLFGSSGLSLFLFKQSLKFEKHQKSLKFEYCKLRKLMSKNLKLVVERVVGYQFNSRKNYDINFVLKRLKFILS